MGCINIRIIKESDKSKNKYNINSSKLKNVG